MIEAIYRRYLWLNEKDLYEGRINDEVKEMCDNSAIGFKDVLEGLTEDEVLVFFHLDKGIQISVFSWHSGCANSFGMPQPMVKQMAENLEKAMADSGYGDIPVVRKIVDKSRETLDWMLSGEYKDLGDGTGVYKFDVDKV